MSIKTKHEPNPFQTPISHGPQTVGRTYGERKAMKAPSPSTTQAPQRHVDNFSHGAKRLDNLAAFSPNVAYSTGRRQTAGVAMRPRILHQIQEGTVRPATNKTTMPSNEAYLAILNKVIDNPAFHNPQNLRRAAMMGNPVGMAKNKKVEA